MAIDITNLNPFQEELRYRIYRLRLKANSEGTIGMSWDCFKQNLDTSNMSHLEGAPKGTNAQWLLNEELKGFSSDLKGFITED